VTRPASCHGASAASCYHATNEVVGVAAHGVSFDKVSRNGGRDFDWFPAPPFDDTETGGSGQVAINHHNRLNIVRVPTGASSGLPRYTTNGGASWQVCTFTPAVPAGNGFHVAYTSTKNTTQADPNHAGHFYILHSQDPGPGLYGLYESTDGGINFQGVCLTSVLGGGADYCRRAAARGGDPGSSTR